MSSIVTWASYSLPGTLINVGADAMCMLYDNILCFTDLKTNAVTYYKAESLELGFSISAICGHNRFALVAFAEVVLMPAIHIIEYPSFSKYAVFKADRILSFVDIRFTEYDRFVALSGYPNYTICIWNFRTGTMMVQQDTMRESLSNSLLLSLQYSPQIVQFSKWNNCLHIWQLCFHASGADIHEVSKITLGPEFSLSNINSMCYGDDNNLYAVDNYGTVSLVDVAQFCIKSQWSITDADEIRNSFRNFKIISHKQGLIIYCSEIIYYIRKKQLKWICEWKVPQASFPRGGIKKLVSNFNGELYTSADLGNLHNVQIDDDDYSVTFNAISNYRENSLDFVWLKGVKDECIIQLTHSQILKAVELLRFNIFSELKIPDACTIAAHNNNPYVMVGTTRGKFHFINYSNIREPVEMASIATKNAYAVGDQMLMDNLAVYHNIYFDFYVVNADFYNSTFYEICPLVHLPENVAICEYFLTDNYYVVLFVNRDLPLLLPQANEMWSFECLKNYTRIKRHEYKLPHIYRDVAGGTSLKNTIEFFAVRLESNVIDILNLKTDANELVLVTTIQTNHLSNITGIVGTRNLLTWGVDGTYIHLRTFQKAPTMYSMSQILQIKFRPRVVKKVLDCLNAKYLVYLYSGGGMKVMKVSSNDIPIAENSFSNDEPLVIDAHQSKTRKVQPMEHKEAVIVHTTENIQARDKLLQKIQELEKEVTALIDYDMSVTGKSQGIFRKFCLNHIWLQKLTAESNKLCDVERNSIEAAIGDQSRIRDWYRKLILSTNSGISFKLRAIFSNFSLENYGLRQKNDKYSRLYDLYYFYEMPPLDKEDEDQEEDSDGNEGKNDMDDKKQKKKKYLSIQGSAYEHIMSDEFSLQDIYTVTGNQMHNQDAKFRIVLTDRLREEFNKKFEETRKIKVDLMDAILATNNTLTTIYDNMNCMLRLLSLDQFTPPALSVPEWQKDEFVAKIMEVDDSEIKAINRRKKKAKVRADKRGRLLLWAIEFWVKALITMMDGVLEKLWEEEIKKDVPIPEFMTKKDPAEYTLEDQKALRKYEEECRVLQEDRKKYLRILRENDVKVNELKKMYILKLNENITQMMILKLKYDFAIHHVRLRNMNTKLMYFNKTQWLARINILRADIELIGEYIQKYVKLTEFWGKSCEELRDKVETLQLKEKSIQRFYKTQFLNIIPQHMASEMNKLLKRRPKTTPKLLNSILICKELARRVNSKAKPKYPFPLPKDVGEYLESLNALDDPTNMPASLELKNWDQFTKIRRQKVEIELKIRTVNLELADDTSDLNTYMKNLGNLKNTKLDAIRNLQEAKEEFLMSVQNQSLEVRLSMGQVELDFIGSLERLQNCMLMNEEDVNDINALILKAGQMKLKAMQRVAFFRRQVIFKEWEHKVVSINIEYLKYMLYVIGKCKVSKEFLNILRNWQKTRIDKQRMLNTVGLIEKTREEKLISFRRQLIRLADQISKVRLQIDEMKRANKRINRQIDQVKVAVAFSTTNRDFMSEDKKRREQNEKMEKIKKHSNLLETVRSDYVHILELKAILELQRLRTYPTLGANPDHCLV